MHQQSIETFNLFDKVFLLSHGKLCYSGPVGPISQCLETVGHPVPAHLTAVERTTNLINTHSSSNQIETEKELVRLADV